MRFFFLSRFVGNPKTWFRDAQVQTRVVSKQVTKRQASNVGQGPISFTRIHKTLRNRHKSSTDPLSKRTPPSFQANIRSDNTTTTPNRAKAVSPHPDTAPGVPSTWARHLYGAGTPSTPRTHSPPNSKKSITIEPKTKSRFRRSAGPASQKPRPWRLLHNGG